jgi:large subunit ribosomal protein L25
MLNSVTIKCKPAEIPEFLEIDVTDMEMNTNLFVKDITLPTDVEMLTAEDIAVVSVQEPKQEKEEVAEDTESSDTDESPDTDEKPAEDEATGESSEEAKDDGGDKG